MTVLANACKEDNFQVVKTLLNRASLDINFNTQDQNGDTPLMHAVRTSNHSLVRLLVTIMQKLNIDVDVRNNNDITPYLEAKRLGYEEIGNVLKSLGRACQTLQIFPLVFDEYSEGTQANNDVWNKSHASRSTTEQSVSRVNRKNKKPIRKNRPVKSALEHKRQGEFHKTREAARCNLSKEEGDLTNFEVKSKREKVSSEKKIIDRALHVNIKNAEAVVDIPNDDETKVNEPRELKSDKIIVDAIKEDETKSTFKEIKHTVKNDEQRPVGFSNETNAEKSYSNSQPQISVSDEKDSENNDIVNFEDLVSKSKSIWQSRFSSKAPSWKRKLQLGEFRDAYSGSGDENRGDAKNAELVRESTISGGLLRKMGLEKPGTPCVTRRSTSNLSVYFNDPVRMPRSRPGSAYHGLQIHTEAEFMQKPLVTEEPPKPKITYEEVFELCPDLKGNPKRSWHSDLRWMLALRGHQNCATYLPAQPARFAFDFFTADPRIENESRLGRRISVSDMKRPSLKKRNTTLSPTAMRETNESR